MAFVVASDEYMQIDLTLFPKIYEKYTNVMVGDIIKLTGRVERRYDTYQIVVSEIEKLN